MAAGRLLATLCRLLVLGGTITLVSYALCACFSVYGGGREGLGSLSIVQAIGIVKPRQAVSTMLQNPMPLTPIAVSSTDLSKELAAAARLPSDASQNIEYDVVKTQQHRLSLVRKVCKERSDVTRPSNWRYKFDPRHNMLYCPIPKSGWSSWKRVFFFINGAIDSMDVDIGSTPDTNASVLDLNVSAVLHKNTTGRFRPYSFVFVRDPWQRLLSAYINRAVEYNYTRIVHQPCLWESMTPYRPPITFIQFLTCIVDRTGNKKWLDVHWTPMWKLCDMCRLSYNTIGHMETMADDASHILKSTGIDLYFPTIFASQAHKAADVAREWYSSVPVTVLRKLQKLYELDFKLHGYSNVPPGWEGRL